MIQIFTNKEVISQLGNSYLFPVLDTILFETSQNLKGYFCFAEDINDADIIVLPYYYDYLIKLDKKNIYLDLLSLATQTNKFLWLIVGGDLPLKINHPLVYVFKMADYHSKLNPRNYILPVFIGDPINRFYNQNFEIQEFSEIPKLGYVGHAKNGFLKYLRTIYIFIKYNFQVFFGFAVSTYFPLYFSSHIRFRYLKLLQKSELLNCKFIFRDRYRAGAKTEAQKIDTTLQFFENIKNTQYTFCIRGGGNFSVRLYETMAMGRIPIQIDTDCVLPLEGFLDWKSHILIIQEKDIKNADTIIRNFHDSFTKEEFENFQSKVRNFWKANLTRENYFIHIHNLFIQNKL